MAMNPPGLDKPSGRDGHVQPGGQEKNEYAGFRAPQRADASTVAGGRGAYYSNPGGEAGNVVDRNRIPRTKDQVSRQGSAAFPGGESTGSSY